MKPLTALIVLLALTAGCGKKADPDAPSGKNLTPVTSSTNAPSTTAPIVVNNGSGSGGGAVQSVRKAVTRTVDANDLKQIQLFIEDASGASGQMPDAKQILSSLKSSPDAARIAKMIEEGDIVLTNIRRREGVWAYPKNALTDGGMIVSNQGVERVTNVDLQARLKQQ